MMSFFLNPWTMVAGAGLVSAPIIIHLINRMRYKRVRWAAMEFLLKAQKRMRRKMIIEQLILLFLRCFLVLLVGVLFGRFLGFDPLQGKETRPTVPLPPRIYMPDVTSMSSTEMVSPTWGVVSAIGGRRERGITGRVRIADWATTATRPRADTWKAKQPDPSRYLRSPL